MSWLSRSTDSRVALADVDDLKARLAASAAERVRLRRALDALPIGVVLADDTGEIEVHNVRAGDQSGHAKVLVAAAVQRQLDRARRGRPGSEIVEFYGPPRTMLHVTARPLGDGGALAMVEDISERARIDRVRTDFVANISHELKTPIGALAVLADALDGEDDSEVVARLAVRIADEAHRASRTIDDLMELARIELGGLATQEPVAIDAVLAEAVGRTAFSAEQHAVTVQVLGQTGIVARGDRRQLVSAITNLVDNAVKYSADGDTVTVTADADDLHVRIIVADTGVGIPAKDLDRVFERFYRVDQARSRDTGGTGLGLAIVRHVASNHGGDIAVSSREGEGSTFTLTIPRLPQ